MFNYGFGSRSISHTRPTAAGKIVSEKEFDKSGNLVRERTETSWDIDDYIGGAVALVTSIFVIGLVAGWIPPNIFTVGVSIIGTLLSIYGVAKDRMKKE